MKKLMFLLVVLPILYTGNIYAKDIIVNGVNLGECKNYFDGCNTCSVGENSEAACTMMACEKNATPKCLDDSSTEDNSLISIEEEKNAKNIDFNFNVEKFSSCEDFTTKVKNYIKDYYEIYPNGGSYRGGDVIMMEDTAVGSSMDKSTSNTVKTSINSSESQKATDYSNTNIQVLGVDEGEIVKTDGKYIYFYNEKEKSIFIALAYPANDLKIVKKIKIPSSYNSPELYIDSSKLTIVASKTSDNDYYNYWFSRSQKTVIITYDLSNISSIKLEKYYEIDGNLRKTRKIGDYVYVISESNFYFPYETYFGPLYKGAPLRLDQNKIDSDLSSAKRLLPKKTELRSVNDIKEKNVNIKGSKKYYNLKNDYVSKCAEIEYIMPNKETLKKFNFRPSYISLSIMNIKDSSKEIKTKLLFGDVSEIYMSLDNLYITSNLYSNYSFKCPQIMCIKAPCIQRCAMPFYRSGENTLIHKINIDKDTTKYQSSTIIPGSPLNQYSMDQNGSDFRIVTTSFYPERYTNLFVLDKNLQTLGKLEKIASGETFQSSRFIGNKLYLVTFEQIDPFFVIDLKDSTSPKILGELKIPGYSTYLHPYDENHLIGLGYDTKENKWGGTQNAGLKIDLYDVSDFSNPKQKYSLTLGEAGSYSDVLNNPRLFVWNSKNNILFMPLSLYFSLNDKIDSYRYSDAEQGSVAIKIDKNSGIKKLAQVTHIDKTGLEEKRREECSKYSINSEAPKCEKVIGGGEYCPPVSNYIPPYCYESSSIGEYFANQIWNYSNYFIIRNLYLDNIWYTISDSKIQANQIGDSWNKISEVNFKK